MAAATDVGITVIIHGRMVQQLAAVSINERRCCCGGRYFFVLGSRIHFVRVVGWIATATTGGTGRDSGNGGGRNLVVVVAVRMTIAVVATGPMIAAISTLSFLYNSATTGSSITTKSSSSGIVGIVATLLTVSFVLCVMSFDSVGYVTWIVSVFETPKTQEDTQQIFLHEIIFQKL